MMEIRKIGRRIRGLVKKCKDCGELRQELFKLYTFKPDGEEKKDYYCRKCYKKLIAGKRIEVF